MRKRLTWIVRALLMKQTAYARTNKNSLLGDICLGILNRRSPLSLANKSRDYFVSRIIEKPTGDNLEPNYLPLHQSYTAHLLDDHYPIGEFSAIHGRIGACNRKWNISVNIYSAYQITRGCLMSLLDESNLVALKYQDQICLAIEIPNTSSLFDSPFRELCK